MLIYAGPVATFYEEVDVRLIYPKAKSKNPDPDPDPGDRVEERERERCLSIR